MNKFLGLIAGLLFAGTIAAQSKVALCTVIDGETMEPLAGVSVSAKNDFVHTTTDTAGKARFRLNPGKYSLSFSCVGYEPLQIEIIIPAFMDTVFTVSMKKEEKEMEQVIISSGRTDSRIENTPTRVEVLGAEEVEEESGVKPSHIASLLGDVAGIQAQQTSAVTGNTDLRIQGLPGAYTQILRDGMPLFGGYAGSFSILQIPPLDLKQIEIIKGASSTLYGGGAIAGMINIISKKPKLNEKERFLLLNQSTLQETNFNIYLSERVKKAGYTFFAGGNYQKDKDINHDGFSDLPKTEGVFIKPTFFFYPNEKNTVSLGVSSTYEDRIGGDMQVLGGYPNNFHQFFNQNQSYRNTVNLQWENRISPTDKLTVKGTTSNFNRNITTSYFGMKARQLSYFGEASYFRKAGKHDIVAGTSVTGERLTKRLPDSTFINNYNYFAVGLFIQDDWHISPKLIAEAGLRTDFHNIYKAFILPRISVLYKASPVVSMRFGGGLGYKAPTIFQSDIDERDYVRLQPLDISIKAEESAGLNWDINFKKKWGETSLAFNQSFYYTRINHPLVVQKTTTSISFLNATKPITTAGMESWLQLSWKGLEAYFGYTLTDSRKKYDLFQPYVELSARNKFASVISYEFSKNLRACIEAAYTGRQYLENGSQSPAYPFIAAMVQWNVSRFSFVLNCENINDYRQTKKEAIVIPPYTNPTFKQLWAPIDGRVANLSMRIKL